MYRRRGAIVADDKEARRQLFIEHGKSSNTRGAATVSWNDKKNSAFGVRQNPRHKLLFYQFKVYFNPLYYGPMV